MRPLFVLLLWLPLTAMAETAAVSVPVLSSEEELTEEQDPTRMNPNFRAALQRMSQKQGADLNDKALPARPRIDVQAIVFAKEPQKSQVMLKIDGGTFLLSAGDKVSVSRDIQIFEVLVQKIEEHAVGIKILPGGETLILR